MHWLDRRQVLLDYLVQRAAAHVSVTLDAPDEPDVRVSVDENFHIAQLAHPVIDEQQDAVDHDDIGGLDARVPLTPEVSDEIVFGLVDCRAVAERLEV